MLKKITIAAALAAVAGAAYAKDIKVGVVLPFSGPSAELGQQSFRGMELYLKTNADKLKPYNFKLIKRDSKNPGGADAKVATQELLTQDKVDIITGYIYSPNAIASAPLINAGRKAAIIANAGTAFITNLTPYYARVSFSMWHASYALGKAVATKLKAKTAVVGYTNYPPGKDSLAAFKKGFESAGGKVIDSIPMGSPATVPDMTPFFERAKEKKPDVLFVFVPAGAHATAVAKTYGALGMKEAGIKLIGPGDITQDNKLQAMGDAAIGIITMHHYNADLDNPENKKFVAAYKAVYGKDEIPDFVAEQGYDAMAAIVHAAQATKGKMSGKAVIASLKGWKFNSPRGPISIDPVTRDVVMNEYLSEVVKKDGRLVQKPIGKLEAVKDGCKELKLGKCARIPK
ncbi:MAG: ABC transporter substrate-binding protein [Hyphomicrobiales bacterium]|nr:ABC transporter substrate-binding protein [Hyphomicrobiales bacterium]